MLFSFLFFIFKEKKKEHQSGFFKCLLRLAVQLDRLVESKAIDLSPNSAGIVEQTYEQNPFRNDLRREIRAFSLKTDTSLSRHSAVVDSLMRNGQILEALRSGSFFTVLRMVLVVQYMCVCLQSRLSKEGGRGADGDIADAFL